MALKAFVTDLSEVDESLHSHYTEKDGGFYLALDDFGKHPGAVTLKATLNRLNTDKDALATKVADLEAKVADLPDDFDPAEWVKRDEKDKPDEALQSLKEQHARAVDALKAKHAKDLADKEAEINERDSYIDGSTRNDHLRKALVEAGFDPAHEEILLSYLGPKVKVRREDSGDRVAYVETDLGEVSPVDFAKDFAAKQGKAYLAKAAGPGAPGSQTIRSGEANPFAATHWNKTEQARLPAEKREAMARAAGFKDYATAVRATGPVAK